MAVKFKIKKSSIVAFAILFPFLPVSAFDYGAIYDLLMLADIAYIFLLYFKSHKKMQKNAIFLSVYMLVLMSACVLNSKNPFPGFYYGGKLLCFVLINEYYLKKQSFELLNVSKKYMSVLICITTFFQYVKQNFFGVMESSGNFKNFFASDNELGYYYIAFIALCLILDMVDGKRISKYTIFMTFVCSLSLYKADAGKSTVGIILILIYIAFIYGRRIEKVFSYWVIVGCYALSFVGIVGFNMQERFSTFIESYLHKDVTLTGRTYIWQSSIQNIKQSLWYGYGVSNGGRLHTSTNLHGTLVSSHNMFLEVLLQVGIIGAVFFILFLLVSLYQRTKGKDCKVRKYLSYVAVLLLCNFIYVHYNTINLYGFCLYTNYFMLTTG